MAEASTLSKTWLRGVFEAAIEDVAMAQAEWDTANKTAEEKLLNARANIRAAWERFELGDFPEYVRETKARKVG